MRELDELARRQQQLANNLSRSQNLTPAQRWQQEMLRRETEELQQRLEQMLQQQASSGQIQGQSGGQASGQSEGSSGETGQNAINRRLQSAIRAMNEAGAPTGDEFDRERLQQAADEAHRQLTGARAQVAEESRREMQQSFGEMTEQASTLYEQQADIDAKLQEAVRRALEARREGRRGFGSGLTPEQREKCRRRNATCARICKDWSGTCRRLPNNIGITRPMPRVNWPRRQANYASRMSNRDSVWPLSTSRTTQRPISPAARAQ